MNPSYLLILLLTAAAASLGWLLRRERKARLEESEKFARERRDSERAQATALRERGAQLGALLDQMIEVLIVVDGAGKIQLANRAAIRLLGAGATVVGRPLLEVFRQHEVAGVIQRLKEEREIRGHEFRTEGAEPRILQINAVALPEGGGALLVIHDVTELRRLESLRQDFVANVSHELRTPLSLIRSAVETLQDGAKDDAAARDKFLAIIDRHGARLGLLIEDLLLLSALDSGRIELNVQPVGLREAVQEVADDLAPAAAERSVALSNEVPAGLVARADALRLRQILSNLVDNAIKHGRESGRVSVTAAPLGGGWLQVSVRDDGAGIPEGARERVFERFFRTDKARARQQGGTGLGLAIVKNLVLAHGGNVRVESAEGRGATFHFKLPAA